MSLPRYFFHVTDGRSLPDLEGTELPDLNAARKESVRLAGALLMEHADDFWKGETWRLDVSDEAGAVLLTLAFSAMEGGRRPDKDAG